MPPVNPPQITDEALRQQRAVDSANASKIAPCPFCGATPDAGVVHIENSDHQLYRGTVSVLCDAKLGGCGASSGYRRLDTEVVWLWNRRRGHETNRDPRTGMTSLEAEVSRLKAALMSYGAHADYCALYKPPGDGCTCGLFEAQGLLPDGKPRHELEKYSREPTPSEASSFDKALAQQAAKHRIDPEK